jgi:hypothetical protein
VSQLTVCRRRVDVVLQEPRPDSKRSSGLGVGSIGRLLGDQPGVAWRDPGAGCPYYFDAQHRSGAEGSHERLLPRLCNSDAAGIARPPLRSLIFRGPPKLNWPGSVELDLVLIPFPRLNFGSMARNLIVSECMTWDGVIQAPGGKEEDPDGGFEHGGWTMPHLARRYWQVLRRTDAGCGRISPGPAHVRDTPGSRRAEGPTGWRYFDGRRQPARSRAAWPRPGG